MGAAAEISRSRDRGNSFDRARLNQRLLALGRFLSRIRGGDRHKSDSDRRFTAEFKVISAGELPKTQLNRQQLKGSIRYKLAAVSDRELPWKSTGFPLSGLQAARFSKFTGKQQGRRQTHSRFGDCRYRSAYYYY
ncbi:hypothetical protein QT971_06980 [Microcoleus sp. herbarium19]|uniref:hypothetical protein n=1 Tax=unclassified Microcoleus TaxID=2642155 RepID=UPI002FD02466